jgi:hypothetical protein
VLYFLCKSCLEISFVRSRLFFVYVAIYFLNTAFLWQYAVDGRRFIYPFIQVTVHVVEVLNCLCHCSCALKLLWWDLKFSRRWVWLSSGLLAPSPGIIAFMMEAVSTSETSVNFYQTTRSNCHLLIAIVSVNAKICAVLTELYGLRLLPLLPRCKLLVYWCLKNLLMAMMKSIGKLSILTKGLNVFLPTYTRTSGCNFDPTSFVLK